MTNDEYWYWICNIKNIFRKDIQAILDVYTSPKEAFERDDLDFQINISEEKLSFYINSKKKETIKRNYDALSKKNIHFVHIGSKEYPDRLLALDDFPYCLYVKGNLPDDKRPSVGMVGARACTGYGREYAAKIAANLSCRNIQIISGMAIGIDSISAKSAISAGGQTFAVLGGGVDVIYPRNNIELYYQIIETGGGIISEYPLGTKPLAYHFPSRNRIIAALSDKLTVIEAGKQSGTLSTAMHALNLGRDVYALPGRINDRLCEGCNNLIYDGAGMIIDIDSLADEMFAGSGFDVRGEYDSFKKTNETELDTESRKVFDLIAYEPVSISKIIDDSSFSTEKVLEILASLELENLIVNVSGAYYMRK